MHISWDYGAIACFVDNSLSSVRQMTCWCSYLVRCILDVRFIEGKLSIKRYDVRIVISLRVSIKNLWCMFSRFRPIIVTVVRSGNLFDLEKNQSLVCYIFVARQTRLLLWLHNHVVSWHARDFVDLCTHRWCLKSCATYSYPISKLLIQSLRFHRSGNVWACSCLVFV